MPRAPQRSALRPRSKRLSPHPQRDLFALRSARSELPLGLGVIGAIALILVPAPTPLLDGLLALQLSGTLLLLLVALRARTPLDLSAFPTLLLLGTLARVSLNISTTRQILTQGEGGALIEAFGDVVVRGEILVGVVIFGLLAAVQYLIIAKGAERVAQVAARFALDSLPGRQLAIDADLKGGVLDADAARSHREGLTEESNLYGALDGAMKFVKGDAIAGLVIIAINAVGGLMMGGLRDGLGPQEALEVYTHLTIGDGLLAQIPATLSATAAAVLVTRTARRRGAELGEVIGRQLLLDGQPLALTALAFMLLALLPGLPAAPLLFVALLAGLLALKGRPRLALGRERFEPTLTTPLALHLQGLGVEAISPYTPLALMDEVRARLRAGGLILPRAEVFIAPDEGSGVTYRIELSGVEAAHGYLPRDRAFRVNSSKPGPSAPSPTGGAPGAWVNSARGLTPAEYLVEHLCALWRRAPQALELQDLSDRLRELETRQPALVRAVLPRRLELPELARLLHRLSREDLPIARLDRVLEILARQEEGLSEEARLADLRAGLAPLIAEAFARRGRLPLICVSGALLDLLEGGRGLGIDAMEETLEELDALLRAHPEAALLAPRAARGQVRAALEARPGVPVLCHEELMGGLEAPVIGVLGADL